jgi:Protein of unknown function (DUF3551)
MHDAFMRCALIGIAILVSGGAAYAQDGASSEYCDPVCLEFRGGAQDCTYHTYAQCEASRSGVGGDCVPNPFLAQCARASVGPKATHRRHR